METKEINLHPKQFEAFQFKTQYCAAIAGVRGGKTYVGSVWAGKKIAEKIGHGLICGPDYKTLQQATLPTFFEIFPQYRKYYKEQKSIIEFPDGKNVYIRSLDDPLSPEGITAAWAWGDEAGKYKLLAWTVLRSRTSMVKGQILLTTTPYDMGWLYQDFYKRWQDKADNDLTVVNWRSVDNPYFPSDFYEKEKTRLRPEEFKRRYEGLFSRMQGLVYQLSSWHLADWQNQKTDITIGGIDWGWSNPAALIVIKLVQGQYFIVDEWYEINKTTGQIVEAAIELQKKWGINRWYADSANPEKIAESITNTGLYVLPYEKQKDSISAGVSYINSLLLENRLLCARGLKNTLAEFETYQYPEADDNGLIKKDEPLPFNNHLMDAMRYAIMGYQPAHRFKTPKQDETYTQLAVRSLLDNRKFNNSQGVEDYL